METSETKGDKIIMGFPTKIQYAHGSWSSWFGCSHVSPGCENCFAEAWAKRSGIVEWGPGKPRRLNKNWQAPLQWDKKAKAAGTKYRILTDLCDPFDCEVPHEVRADYFSLIHRTENLNWLVLTKRIYQVKTFLDFQHCEIPKNVWLGVTVCNQEEADRDIPILLSIPATKHWISYEPALGPVDFLSASFAGAGSLSAMEGIDWIIAGCESGPKRRPANLEWFRSARDQCSHAEVPFFLKQMEINSKIVHLPYLDGCQWTEIPE
jgi:protein gp37